MPQRREACTRERGETLQTYRDAAADFWVRVVSSGHVLTLVTVSFQLLALENGGNYNTSFFGASVRTNELIIHSAYIY